MSLVSAGKWIEFHAVGRTKNGLGRTMIYEVRRQGGGLLGGVKWFGRWRCYAFFPEDGTLFEKDCLRDIAGFCERVTKEHRDGKTPAASTHLLNP